MVALLLAGVALLWLGQASLVARLMDGRGYHPLPWFVVSLLLGPAAWGLALVEVWLGPPASRLVRSGRYGPGALDVCVVTEDQDAPRSFATQIARLKSHCRRLVFVRVVKWGGPAWVESDAEASLHRLARQTGADDVELRIAYGDIDRVIRSLNRTPFDLVLRSDRRAALLDGAPEIRGVRCLRDEPAG